MTSINLNNVSLLEESDPIHMQLTNSGTRTADAYVFVDFDGSIEASSIYISTSSGSSYIGIEDYIKIKEFNDGYAFRVGALSNTSVFHNSIILDNALSGNYITPVIDIGDDYNIANVCFLYNTISGINDLTFYYRASNERPVDINEVYWQNSIKFNPITSEYIDNTSWSRTPVWVVASNMLGGLVCVSTTANTILTADRDGNVLYQSGAAAKYNFDRKMEVNSEGAVYGYNNAEDTLIRTDLAFEDIDEYTEGSDFLLDFSSNPTVSGNIWYLNYYDKGAKKLTRDFDLLGSAYFTDPVSICGNNDGSCWVAERNDNSVYKVSNTFEIGDSVAFDELPYKIYSDFNNGFWFLGYSVIIHIDSAGNELNRTSIFAQNLVIPEEGNYFLACEKGAKVIHVLNKSTLNKIADIKTENNVISVPGYMCRVFNDKNLANYFPLSTDDEWGDNSSLSWLPVTDCILLPRFRYYQFKIDLETNNINKSPRLNEIYLSRALKFRDIAPGQSIDFYVKFKHFGTLDYNYYMTKLKHAWSENG